MNIAPATKPVIKVSINVSTNPLDDALPPLLLLGFVGVNFFTLLLLIEF